MKKMNKSQKKIPIINFLLILFLVISSLYSFSVYKKNKEINNDIHLLEEKLKKEKEISVIYDRSKEFIEKSSIADHGDMLTGQAKEMFEDAIKQKEREGAEDSRSHSILERTDIDHIFAVKTGDNTAKSYAIYKSIYNSNPYATDSMPQQVMTLTMIVDWEKVNGEYKVSDYRINVLKNSLDDYLKSLEK
ncbi:TPA: hypothetical protein QCW10_006032 [Bacillus thuringiensis]|uniref:Uncharacterized protein n=7 Tax=Bacillus TaxID=1386 RepID=A0AAP4V587_BACTU|nr:hypothetical protein CT43_P127055 [Bacillus thuringiensis serovar chinensis CT-43]AGG04766.1 hypothetical protein H175_107p042 [Bacillus thuringiensis serovar thuringiensis str. IS5056]AHZ55167.1 hypothetical protein YBT1520_32856 [Bacillus thuringiensis serovar kurstaki str. YBT-1520]AIE37114.1 hypothetical protein BTK_32941 [Bacillus thuringiensis serovar kurstaki str. HD-1]AKJ63135.1 hypothetical protein XI92_33900 [Bacillus thuringiensis]EEM31341.1 hypothetical protein bthur0003_61770 [